MRVENLSDEEWAKELKNQIEWLIKENEEKSTYLINLPEYVDFIPEDVKSLPRYGHPISWLLYGAIGIKAFAIGRMTTEEPKDDKSEKHMVPPVLYRSLLKAGSDYIYSQEAIVIFPYEKEPEFNNQWLDNWLDERTYMKRTRIYEQENQSVLSLAEQLFIKVFNPWNGVKRLEQPTEKVKLYDLESFGGGGEEQ